MDNTGMSGIVDADLTETVYGSQDDSQDMSERVQLLAANIYEEFERLIQKYDENVVKELMPLVVAVLESLDQTLRERQEVEIEIDLLREDNDQLLTQYEREKQLRKSAELKFLKVEDDAEEDKLQLQDKLESLESIVRLFEIKMKNAQDQISRLEEKDVESGKEYSKLHERYTDLLKAHFDFKERTKLLSSCDVMAESTVVVNPRNSVNPVIDTERMEPVVGRSLTEADNTVSISQSDDSVAAVTDSSTVHRELMDFESCYSDSKPGWTPKSLLESPTERKVRGDVVSSNEAVQTDDLASFNDGKFEDLDDLQCSSLMSSFEQKKSSLYDELTVRDADAIMQMDYGANIVAGVNFFGMSHEVENLIQENTELLATKNALNIVKDDLIARVDELTSEKDVLREEINSLEVVKDKLKVRIAELEDEVCKIREAFSKKSDDTGTATNAEDASPVAQKKRFTRVEMARVLLERNQYKERLLELQESVRWAEMLRASRDQPDALGGRKKSSIWNFFSRLFTSSDKPSKKPTTSPALSYKSSAKRGTVRPVGDPNRSPRERTDGQTSRAFDFLQDDFSKPVLDDKARLTDRARQQRKQERRMRCRQQSRALALEREDGRLQAYGWSLPSKFMSSASGSSSNNDNGSVSLSTHIAVPVPVYCRPVSDVAGVKLWCAAAVNVTDSRTRDGGSIVGTSVFYSHTADDITSSPQSVTDEVEQLNQQLQEHEKDVKELENQQTSSLVWIAVAGHNCSEVNVVDANSPGDVLDTFYVCSSRVLCIASVPGAAESDYGIDSDVVSCDSVTMDNAQRVSSDAETSSHLVGKITFVQCSTGSAKSVHDVSLDAVSDEEYAAHVASAQEVEDSLIGKTQEAEGGSQTSPRLSTSASHRLEHVLNSDLVKDGISSTDNCSDVVRTEILQLSTVLPTMWIGAQSGRVYVHSAVLQWKRCLHSVQLPSAVVALSHVKGRVFAALANGSVAIFSRSAGGQWAVDSYHIVTIGEAAISVRCLTVVANQRIWCAHRNCVHVVDPVTLKIETSFDAHPRHESQVRQMCWVGEGVWLSIRLDSTLRLFHAYTYQHLQDVDVEPYVSKLLGVSTLGFTFVRISSLITSCNRLWIGTGNGVILRAPLSESVETGIITSLSASENSRKSASVSSSTSVKPDSVVRVYSHTSTDSVFPGSFIPYCNISQAQLSFHGHKDAVKFFIAVPGEPVGCLSGVTSTSSETSTAENRAASLRKTILVMSGGEGYVDFRLGDVNNEDSDDEAEEQSRTVCQKADRSHLIVWQVFTDS